MWNGGWVMFVCVSRGEQEATSCVAHAVYSRWGRQTRSPCCSYSGQTLMTSLNNSHSSCRLEVFFITKVRLRQLTVPWSTDEHWNMWIRPTNLTWNSLWLWTRICSGQDRHQASRRRPLSSSSRRKALCPSSSGRRSCSSPRTRRARIDPRRPPPILWPIHT